MEWKFSKLMGRSSLVASLLLLFLVGCGEEKIDLYNNQIGGAADPLSYILDSTVFWVSLPILILAFIIFTLKGMR